MCISAAHHPDTTYISLRKLIDIYTGPTSLPRSGPLPLTSLMAPSLSLSPALQRLRRRPLLLPYLQAWLYMYCDFAF